MYKIRYDNQSITCNTADEVIAALSKLHTYYKNIEAKLISIRWDSSITLQLGVGDVYDRFFILTVPRDSSEDYKITFNGNLGACQDCNIHYTSDSFTFSCYECNIIFFEEAMKEVHYILLHQARSEALNWYSH